MSSVQIPNGPPAPAARPSSLPPDLSAAVTASLPLALEDDTLVLHFQPEVDLASGAVVGMEALIRWQHPLCGLLWPGDFLPIADSLGLAPRIGEWVLRRCVDELRSWERLPPRPGGEQRQLWVNISAAQLLCPGFVEMVADLIAGAGLPGGALGVEVTEEAVGRAPELAARLLRELRVAGAATAIDDFGTWYSTLATLDDLPIDAVKLDRSFVRGVGSDLEDDNIVASVIRLAHARDKYVVAEGVESWAEGARLCELGCDRALGYLFSGPQRGDRARWMLTRGTGWRGPHGEPTG
ncbi:MAG TPA: EAL domain-containing protein [Mycobacteriales bacterium]|jgi:EAL domain-containing protein (putative c-di-GMP-specific phosphodiesterase class I)|nr:EAL domain-containing protein [Mycobacteriales bacterium]